VASDIYSLAVRYHLSGNLRLAEQCYRQVLQLQPDFAEALLNLANILVSQGRLEEAMIHCQGALRLRPDLAQAHNTLGNILVSQGKLEEAVAQCLEALRLQPNYPEAHNSLGNALSRQGKLEEAATHYQKAIDHKPEFAEARTNLGNVRKYQLRLEEALACYQQALQANPGHPDRHFNRAILWLLLGDWERGWREYEWRWLAKGFSRLTLLQSRWDGSPLEGRTLLILTEQGLGDSIQFIRYLPQVRRLGGKVIVQCQRALLPLLTDFVGAEHLIAEGQPLPPFDLFVPLLSIPGVFATTPNCVPADVPYLHAAPGLMAQWRQIMSDVRRPVSGARSLKSTVFLPTPDSGLRTPDSGRYFRIGISWQGSASFPGDRQRSIALSHFATLSKIDGVQLISMQKGPGEEQQQALTSNFGLRTPDRIDEDSGPFMDTAAILMSLDLVIASDSAIAHLAGALGVPVWVALSFVPDWRWLLQREDTPWYPSIRLFRQSRHGHWEGVFDRMAEQVRAVLAGR
jgi:Flp pilus assembly protein TadD